MRVVDLDGEKQVSEWYKSSYEQTQKAKNLHLQIIIM